MRSVLVLVVIALIGGAISAPRAQGSDATVKRTILAGATVIRTAKGKQAAVLEQKLAAIQARLKTDRATTPKGKQARLLALDGFNWMLRGVRESIAVSDALDLASPDDYDALAAAVAGATRVNRMQTRGSKAALRRRHFARRPRTARRVPLPLTTTAPIENAAFSLQALYRAAGG